MDHWTGTRLEQVQFPSAWRDLSPRVSFQCRLLNGALTPPCAIARINICANCRCQNSVDYGNTETPSMHHRLNSPTVTAGFPCDRQPRFPMREMPVGQYNCQKKKNAEKDRTSIFVALLIWKHEWVIYFQGVHNCDFCIVQKVCKWLCLQFRISLVQFWVLFQFEDAVHFCCSVCAQTTSLWRLCGHRRFFAQVNLWRFIFFVVFEQGKDAVSIGTIPFFFF